VSFILDLKKQHRCVPKDNAFRCLANGRSIKVDVELSGTITSHKTLTLVVGMTMILDDFLKQWMFYYASCFVFLFFFVYFIINDMHYNTFCILEKKMAFSAFHCLTLSVRCEELDAHINYLYLFLKSTYCEYILEKILSTSEVGPIVTLIVLSPLSLLTSQCRSICVRFPAKMVFFPFSVFPRNRILLFVK
jgi:hypothetical protein